MVLKYFILPKIVLITFFGCKCLAANLEIVYFFFNYIIILTLKRRKKCQTFQNSQQFSSYSHYNIIFSANFNYTIHCHSPCKSIDYHSTYIDVQMSIIPQMSNRVTNHGDMSTFSKPVHDQYGFGGVGCGGGVKYPKPPLPNPCVGVGPSGIFLPGTELLQSRGGK